MDVDDTSGSPDEKRSFDKVDMLIVMVHELIMSKKKHADGRPYKNLPEGIKKLLANSTSNVTETWNTNDEAKRKSWWNMWYGNYRSAMGDQGGLPGVSPDKEKKLKAASKFFENHTEEAIKIGLELLQKPCPQETNQLLIEMGLSTDEWLPYINEHGRDPILDCVGIEKQEQPSLLDRLAEEDLDSLEQIILGELRKASEKMGGAFSKNPSIVHIKEDIPRFKIWFGIPGTGKSFQLQEYVRSKVQDMDKDVFRTVFHPEYSMYDFIGQIQPKQNEKDDAKISYPFEPGPFTRALIRARSVQKAGNEHKVFLIIEELNRGNAAAIFGEVFQLLDLAEDGESQYGIVQKDIAGLLRVDETLEIKLPSNLNIYATMNVSDQNVFPLDTAFLRRWDREYVFADTWEGACTQWMIKLPNHESIPWQSFAETINTWLIRNADDIGINHPEDKRLGPWFVDERTCNDPLLFANKVLPYLWTNVFVFGTARDRVFSKAKITLDWVLKQYYKDGLRVFSDDLFEIFSENTETMDTDGRREAEDRNSIEIDADGSASIGPQHGDDENTLKHQKENSVTQFGKNTSEEE